MKASKQPAHRDLGDAYGRVLDGSLTDEELAALAEMLRTGEYRGVSEWTAVKAVAAATRPEHEPLLAARLQPGTAPEVAACALRGLVDYRCLALKYKQPLIDFAEGTAWAEDDFLQSVAIGEMGAVLRGEDDADFLESLLYLHDSPSSSDEVREAAYLALARAGGHGHREIMGWTRATRPASVVEQARARLARMRSSG